MQFGPKITAFLAAIRQYPNITVAAKAARIHPSSHYEKLKRSDVYKRTFEDAYRQGLDAVADVAMERATFGWDEPIVYQGSFCYPEIWDAENHRWIPDQTKPPLTQRKIDNRLLEFMLERRHPNFREKAEVSGPLGGPLIVQKFSGSVEELLSLYKEVQAE